MFYLMFYSHKYNRIFFLNFEKTKIKMFDKSYGSKPYSDCDFLQIFANRFALHWVPTSVILFNTKLKFVNIFVD